MIQKLVSVALRMPLLVLAAAVALVALGLRAYSDLDIEAYPNPVPPLVEIIAQPEGMSAEDVERYVTVPLEIGLAGMPGLDHVRSQSLFGLADVKCYFRWGTEYKDARQEVLNRLASTSLPDGVAPTISPWNAIGEVFRYQIVGPGYSLQDLKTAEDWILERQFKQVPGVVDVVSFGGETKQYQINVDPFRLRGHGVTLGQIVTAVQSANKNVGGQRLALGEQAYTIRGIGLLRDVHDLEDVVVAERGGVPIRVRDVAQVELGHTVRLGIVGHDDEPDVVQGVVLMRYGGETPKTLEGIHERVAYVEKNHLLPPGMHIAPYYDRGNLVKLTTHTVLENLVVGMALVSLVLWLFLGHTRAAMITALNIPLALLAAFCGMSWTGTPANLISLGAVDFGIVVDSTVIMVENVFHHLGGTSRRTISERILAASAEVSGPMASSTAIIGVAFLPLFTMRGVSGVIFSPMAHTYAFAIGGAILLALTLTPTLAARALPAETEEAESFVMRQMQRFYVPIFRRATEHPRRALAIGLLPVALGLLGFPLLGGEFMPKLEEGNFWIRATLPTSISLEQSSKYVGKMRAILRGCPLEAGAVCDEKTRRRPEVLTVVSQLGRPDDGTDLAGFQNVELFAPLAPFDAWPRGVTKESLTEELAKELSDAFPGVTFSFSQMISDNVEEAVSGVKGENSIKVFGPDVRANEANASSIVATIGQVAGVKDLGMFSSLGQPSIRIEPDRKACARYGLNTGDVEAVVQAAIGGQVVTQVLEGDRRFDVAVRWLEAYRTSLESIREITVATSDGGVVPLGQIAKISIEDSPSVIFREDGQRYAPVKFSVRGRDLATTVGEAQARIAASLHLPYDSHLEWSGQMTELKEATRRLLVVVPLTLALILLLVYGSVKTGIDTAIVATNLPIACAGGILALLVTRVTFSVSAAMGFISIFGIAVQDAILVVTSFQRMRAEGGTSVRQAAFEASSKRLRPVLMTTLVAMFGLLPAAVSTGIGSQTQKPLAVVVIGGALMLALFARVVQPALLVVAHRALERRAAAKAFEGADAP